MKREDLEEFIHQKLPGSQLGGIIGSGGFGNVYEIHGYNNPELVVKVVGLQEHRENRTKEIYGGAELTLKKVVNAGKNEINALRQLKGCKYVVNYLDSIEYEDEPDNYSAFIIEQKYTTLTRYKEDCPDFGEKAVIRIAGDICKALISLQNAELLHRDINDHNILVDISNGETRFILSDFGSACDVHKHEYAATVTGAMTPGFIAPEIISGDPGVKIGYNCDIYSLGITLLRLLEDENERPQLDRMDAFGISKPLQKIIKKATQSSPAKRYQTAEEMLYDLNKLESGYTTDVHATISFLHSKFNHPHYSIHKQPKPVEKEVKKKETKIVKKTQSRLSFYGLSILNLFLLYLFTSEFMGIKFDGSADNKLFLTGILSSVLLTSFFSSWDFNTSATKMSWSYIIEIFLKYIIIWVIIDIWAYYILAKYGTVIDSDLTKPLVELFGKKIITNYDTLLNINIADTSIIFWKFVFVQAVFVLDVLIFYFCHWKYLPESPLEFLLTGFFPFIFIGISLVVLWVYFLFGNKMTEDGVILYFGLFGADSNGVVIFVACILLIFVGYFLFTGPQINNYIKIFGITCILGSGYYSKYTFNSEIDLSNIYLYLFLFMISICWIGDFLTPKNPLDVSIQRGFYDSGKMMKVIKYFDLSPSLNKIKKIELLFLYVIVNSIGSLLFVYFVAKMLPVAFINSEWILSGNGIIFSLIIGWIGFGISLPIVKKILQKSLLNSFITAGYSGMLQLFFICIIAYCLINYPALIRWSIVGVSFGTPICRCERKARKHVFIMCCSLLLFCGASWVFWHIYDGYYAYSKYVEGISFVFIIFLSLIILWNHTKVVHTNRLSQLILNVCLVMFLVVLSLLCGFLDCERPFDCVANRIMANTVLSIGLACLYMVVCFLTCILDIFGS